MARRPTFGLSAQKKNMKAADDHYTDLAILHDAILVRV